MKQIHIHGLKDLQRAAADFVQIIDNHKVFAFSGEMGAGKTTFIKALCQSLGVSENITSPTFAIVNEYPASDGITIYHFDCYRLKNIREAYDLGAEEYFYSGYYCFIEWPEKIAELLPDDTVHVRITIQHDKSRLVTIQ